MADDFSVEYNNNYLTIDTLDIFTRDIEEVFDPIIFLSGKYSGRNNIINNSCRQLNQFFKLIIPYLFSIHYNINYIQVGLFNFSIRFTVLNFYYHKIITLDQEIT